jgi:hypothetical protein
METKDWLDIVVIPVVLGLIALLWPWIQSRHRRKRFTSLIFRELQELELYPKESLRDHWADHLTKNFAHRAILKDVSQNRDFVLSLNPDLLYHLLQLWAAYDVRDEAQWLYSLDELAKYDRSGKLRKVRAAWADVFERYGKKDTAATGSVNAA